MARPTFERNHAQKRHGCFCARVSDGVRVQECRPYREVNGTDEISSFISARKPHQERGLNTSFIFFGSRFKQRDRPRRKSGKRTRENSSRTNTVVGHRFGGIYSWRNIA